MTPDFVSDDGRVKLYNVDCMDYMATCKENEFDLAVVDPPYRDENQPDQWMRSNGSMKSLQGRPCADYFNDLLTVSENQIIWGANNFELRQWKGFLFWRKTGINNDVHFSCGEVASISEGLGTVCKVIDLHTNTKGKIHPTQKPVKLYDWIYANYAKKGQRILDTHLGSGSNAIAAHYAGMEFVGCELDKDYFWASVERFKQATAQGDIFQEVSA